MSAYISMIDKIKFSKINIFQLQQRSPGLGDDEGPGANNVVDIVPTSKNSPQKRLLIAKVAWLDPKA